MSWNNRFAGIEKRQARERERESNHFHTLRITSDGDLTLFFFVVLLMFFLARRGDNTVEGSIFYANGPTAMRETHVFQNE
jgi:hypothetical protein